MPPTQRGPPRQRRSRSSSFTLRVHGARCARFEPIDIGTLLPHATGGPVNYVTVSRNRNTENPRGQERRGGDSTQGRALDRVEAVRETPPPASKARPREKLVAS